MFSANDPASSARVEPQETSGPTHSKDHHLSHVGPQPFTLDGVRDLGCDHVSRRDPSWSFQPVGVDSNSVDEVF